ncbi:hypothetical protein [Paenibacillus gansuensis]|uniref:Replicative helicase inhibitor G39P N-terminal domain-containing protein n=1 Tax=Paenibacillus gansuensis TaxID=306542 RepID=A0ABW5PDW8_9BACL
MNESEVRKLFLVIENTMGGFFYDDYKVALWTELLKTTTYDLAETNLKRYIMNPDNKYPPTPGQLAVRPTAEAAGPHIPNAADTRLMLEQVEKDRELKAVPMPEKLKEKVKQLATRSWS